LAFSLQKESTEGYFTASGVLEHAAIEITANPPSASQLRIFILILIFVMPEVAFHMPWDLTPREY
jgi:hypothetical protein